MRKRIIALISFLCYIVCWTQAADEHYYFKNLSIKDGLSQTTVNAIMQDKKGFMWFGTKGGLSRYDGMSFRNFKRDMPVIFTDKAENRILRLCFFKFPPCKHAIRIVPPTLKKQQLPAGTIISLTLNSTHP